MRWLAVLLLLFIPLTLAHSQGGMMPGPGTVHAAAGSTPLVQSVDVEPYGGATAEVTVASGSNLFLLVYIHLDGITDVTAVNYGISLQTMTQVAEVNPGTSGAGSFGRTEVWRLIAPEVQVNGQVNITGGTANRIVVGVVFTNTHQTTPLGTATTANGTNNDLTVGGISANAADLVIGGGSISLNGSETWTNTQTSRWDASGTGLRGVGESAVGATTIGGANNISDSLEWSLIAVAVKGA